MTTRTQTTPPEINTAPVENQELVDQLSALVVTGAIDTYAAKDCLECGDWKRARRLIREAGNE